MLHGIRMRITAGARAGALAVWARRCPYMYNTASGCVLPIVFLLSNTAAAGHLDSVVGASSKNR